MVYFAVCRAEAPAKHQRKYVWCYLYRPMSWHADSATLSTIPSKISPPAASRDSRHAALFSAFSPVQEPTQACVPKFTSFAIRLTPRRYWDDTYATPMLYWCGTREIPGRVSGNWRRLLQRFSLRRGWLFALRRRSCTSDVVLHSTELFSKIFCNLLRNVLQCKWRYWTLPGIIDELNQSACTDKFWRGPEFDCRVPETA